MVFGGENRQQWHTKLRGKRYRPIFLHTVFPILRKLWYVKNVCPFTADDEVKAKKLLILLLCLLLNIIYVHFILQWHWSIKCYVIVYIRFVVASGAILNLFWVAWRSHIVFTVTIFDRVQFIFVTKNITCFDETATAKYCSQ